MEAAGKGDLGAREIGRASPDGCSACAIGSRGKPRTQLHRGVPFYDGSETTVWFALALATGPS